MHIWGLVRWSTIYDYYTLWLMMVYLTDVWKINFVQAAAIVNIWMGLSKVLYIFSNYIADAFLGNLIVYVLSTLSFTTGLGLIWMSTPPVLAKSYGNCTEYNPECIGKLQKNLVYAGLALVAVGISGQQATETSVASEQPTGGRWSCNCNCKCTCFCIDCKINFIGVAALLVTAFVKPWHTLFGIAAIFALVTFLILSTRACCYNHVGPQGSSVTTVFRVLFAAFSKLSYNTPKDIIELHENHYLDRSALLPHTDGLRLLDKAAIMPTLPQHQKNRWRLCRITEVEEVKALIRMMPIWTTFIICGLISSLGSTYFLEQAKHINPKSGRGKIPLLLFLWLYAQFRGFFVLLSAGAFTLAQLIGLGNRYLPRLAIPIAMLFTVFCCITAARVETRRLQIVQIHGLIDKPDERVPMNVFSILPQFIFLAGADGLFLLGCNTLTMDQAPITTVNFFNYVAHGFYGLGFMANPLLAYIVGTISEKSSGTNWFQSTLNKSRLDNYYWFLATLAAINLLVYIVMAIFRRYRESRLEQYAQLSIEVNDSVF